MSPTDYFRSTPFRIVVVYTVLFLASAAILFTVLYWSVTQELMRETRAAIEEDIRPLVAAYSAGHLKRLVEAVGERATAAKPGETLILLQTSNRQFLSGNISPYPPFTGWRELSLQLPNRADEIGGEHQAVLARGVRLGAAFLLVGRNLRHVDETQELLLRSLVWTLAVTFGLALMGGAVLSRGALKRVETINRTIARIVGGSLSQRIPTKKTGDELDNLAANINRMLERIEQLMMNLQQVSSDIAHDLRTPLGRLRQRLETVRSRNSNIEDYRAAVDLTIEDTDSILSTFAALLRIAQIESGSRRAQFATVDLSNIVHRIFEAYESVVEDAGQHLTVDVAPGVEIWGDKDLLTQMLANLVENAIRHCPVNTRIAIALIGGEEPTLAVADNGLGIPPAEKDAVLKRFYRLEKSRTTPGNGLGLALVNAVAELHFASLKLSDNHNGLRVTIQFSMRKEY